jgi:hypothetical protein
MSEQEIHLKLRRTVARTLFVKWAKALFCLRADGVHSVRHFTDIVYRIGCVSA